MGLPNNLGFLDAARPATALTVNGPQNTSAQGSTDDLSVLPQPATKKQVQLDPAAAVIVAAWSGIALDLLAESVELAIGYGVNILAAIRAGDDAAVLAEFRGFDASARTARHCAERLREKERLENRGRQ